jgi:hypothetical protein
MTTAGLKRVVQVLLQKRFGKERESYNFLLDALYRWVLVAKIRATSSQNSLFLVLKNPATKVQRGSRSAFRFG